MNLPKNNQTSTVILPNETIGIIGGGQLGRMMAIAAKYMGYQVIVLDPTPNCPTGQVADQQIVAAYDDMAAIEQLTSLSDVITYEFENVDLKAAAYIESQGKLPQGSYALEVTQNRAKEKQLMKASQLPVPPFHIVNNVSDCDLAFKKIQFPAVIKTCHGGYDGKGQIKLENMADKEQVSKFVEKNGSCIIEEWISFEKEISVIFTRSQTGDITFFPIAENEHKDHILYKTTVPANISEHVKEQAYEAAKILADKVSVVGTFAIEMFVKDDNVLINEMAPRPHNSGHYTIEACNVSQFTQHIRAICRLPLEKIHLLQSAVMINILGEDLEHTLTYMQSNSGFVHLYGKDEAKAKRKMGHITFIADTVEELEQSIEQFQEAGQ